jgi:hypothetical protein
MTAAFNWLRSFDAAKSEAARKNRAILPDLQMDAVWYPDKKVGQSAEAVFLQGVAR